MLNFIDIFHWYPLYDLDISNLDDAVNSGQRQIYDPHGFPYTRSLKLEQKLGKFLFPPPHHLVLTKAIQKRLH